MEITTLFPSNSPELAAYIHANLVGKTTADPRQNKTYTIRKVLVEPVFPHPVTGEATTRVTLRFEDEFEGLPEMSK